MLPPRMQENSIRRLVCEVCDNAENNVPYIAREMMFGLRDEFVYFECAGCGCLQIADLPVDLSKYYGRDYYSLRPPAARLRSPEDPFRRFFRRQRAQWILHRRPLGGIVPKLDALVVGGLSWLRHTGVRLDSAILDVGCGAGHLLLNLRRHGFTDLVGIDPLVQRDSSVGTVRILKNRISEIDGAFDLVMLHHTLEHMPHQALVFADLARLLKPGGSVLVRTPLCGTFAWKHYGTNWVQLDAPRHLCLHTVTSIEILAKRARLGLDRIVFDSNAFQFWGSEQYLRDIPLADVRSYSVNPAASIFSTHDLRRFHAKASALNRSGDGDQACFYFRKN